MAGKWNSKNRRMAKLRARDNWFKGSQEVEPPGVQKDGNPEESSRVMDSNQEGEEATERSDQDQSNSMDDGRKDAGDSQADQETTKGVERGSSRRMEKKLTKLARKGKKRGPNRQTVTLGGVKRQEKSESRRTKRQINRDLGKARFPANRKSRADKLMMEPPVSVLFVDNTKNGMLAKMLQKVEKRLGGITSYRVRIAESAAV